MKGALMVDRGEMRIIKQENYLLTLDMVREGLKIGHIVPIQSHNRTYNVKVVYIDRENNEVGILPVTR
jgi:hypothetical protein